MCVQGVKHRVSVLVGKMDAWVGSELVCAGCRVQGSQGLWCQWIEGMGFRVSEWVKQQDAQLGPELVQVAGCSWHILHTSTLCCEWVPACCEACSSFSLHVCLWRHLVSTTLAAGCHSQLLLPHRQQGQAAHHQAEYHS